MAYLSGPNSYRLLARWSARPDDITACAAQVVRMLENFGRCDPPFDRWNENGLTRRESSVPFSTLPPQLGPMIRRLDIERVRNQDGEPIHNLAIVFGANSAAPGLPAKLLASVGREEPDHDELPNHIDINLADGPSADWLKTVLLGLVDAWHPAVACVRAPGMAGLADKSSILPSGWMTYLAAPLARQIVPPIGASTEMTADGGLLIILAADPFDAENPLHLAAFKAIQAALAALELSTLDQEPAQ